MVSQEYPVVAEEPTLTSASVAAAIYLVLIRKGNRFLSWRRFETGKPK